jgi:hypothetical protein
MGWNCIHASFTIRDWESTSDFETAWELKIRVLPRSAMKATGRARSVRGAALAIAGLLSVGGSVAAAEQGSGSTDIDRRWIPSASFFTLGMVQQRTAQMSADVRVKQGDPLLNRDGQTFGLPWSVGGTLDVASPVLLDVPGKPRLFAHGDVGYAYGLEEPVVTRGDPGSQPFLPPGSTSPVAIENVGAAIRAETKPLIFSGGIGGVFSFDAFERGIRVRPTLEWSYQRDTMKNYLGAGEAEGAGSSCAPCRTLFIKTQTEKGFHSLGPGMEVEADVGRAGQFLVGFYSSFRAYYIVGDRTANLKSKGSWFRTDNGQPSVRADTTFVTRYEREPWHYRFGAGIRILWSPEE